LAVRIIPRSEAIAKLTSYGCKPLHGKGRLNTAEWWRWPWGGTPFLLPFEGETVDAWALQKLVADMAALAPPGWKFPDDDSEAT
jgi:hypothetical protein